MPLTFQAKTVTVEGLPDSHALDPLKLISVNIPHGQRWGLAGVMFPSSYALSQPSLNGSACTIKLDGTTLLRGHVVRTPNTADGNVDEVRIDIADLRWEMSRRKIGQKGIGPLVDVFGGFPHVGYRVHFNPGGVGNRSKNFDPDGDQTYTFETKQDSALWSLKQMLHFIAFWYYPDLHIDDASLNANWDNTESDLNLYTATVPQALFELAKRAGQSWALRYDSDTTYFQPVGGGTIPGTLTVNLPEADGDSKAQQATVYSAVDFDIDVSITDSCDTIEVHSGPIAHETLYSNHGDNPLLMSPTDVSPPSGYARIFFADVTKYEDWKLGLNLPSGSKPKKWLRQNVTRVNDQRAFIAQGSSDLLTRYGRPMLPEDCCWVNFDGNETKYKLLSGISILFDDGIILIHNHVETSQGSIDFVEGASPDMYLWITLTTELELPYVYINTPSAYHIDATHPITVPIVRSDIRPMTRYKSLMPDYSSTDLTATVEFAADDTEYYFQVDTDLQKVQQVNLSARGKKEVTARIQLLDIPMVTLGSKLAISPADAGLTGDEVVVEIDYDLENGDHVLVTATNHLGRVFLEEL